MVCIKISMTIQPAALRFDCVPSTDDDHNHSLSEALVTSEHCWWPPHNVE